MSPGGENKRNRHAATAILTGASQGGARSSQAYWWGYWEAFGPGRGQFTSPDHQG